VKHTCGRQVFLNGERLPIKTFQEYVGLYIGNKDAPRVYERVNDRWEVCVLASEGQFHQACAPGLQTFTNKTLMLSHLWNILLGT